MSNHWECWQVDLWFVFVGSFRIQAWEGATQQEPSIEHNPVVLSTTPITAATQGLSWLGGSETDPEARIYCKEGE